MSKLDIQEIMLNNPISLVIILFFGLFLGASVISTLTNVILWFVVILSVMIIKPKENQEIALSVGLGTLWWLINIAIEFSNRSWFCNIPLIGGILCGTADIILFVPRIINLIVIIVAIRLMIYITDYIIDKFN